MYGSFFLFFFPFFSFSSFLFAAFFFLVIVSVCLSVCLFLNKTLALKDSNTIQTVATNPTPGAQAGLGTLRAPLAFFVAVFLVPSLASGASGQVRGPVAGGICTAVMKGDGHKKGYLNEITTKSRAPTKTAGDAHEGTWDTVEKR